MPSAPVSFRNNGMRWLLYRNQKVLLLFLKEARNSRFSLGGDIGFSLVRGGFYDAVCSVFGNQHRVCDGPSSRLKQYSPIQTL